MFKRINEALPGLLLGILFYGILVELIGVWFVEDKWAYSIGLAIGIFCALGIAVHMAVTLDIAMDLGSEKAARAKVTTQGLLRYALVVVLFILVVFLKVGNPVTAVLGIFGLKAAAYLQPLMHKLFPFLNERNQESQETE